MKINRREALAALGVGVLVSNVEAQEWSIPNFISSENLTQYLRQADPRFNVTVDFNTVVGDTIKEKYESIVFVLTFSSKILNSDQILLITSPEVCSLFETCESRVDPITGERQWFYTPKSSKIWEQFGNESSFLLGNFNKSIEIQEGDRTIEYCPTFHLYKNQDYILPAHQLILKDANSNRSIAAKIENFII